MPILSKFFADFTEQAISHVSNKASNLEKLFYMTKTGILLKKYNPFLDPYPDNYCWRLLPDHFHLLVRTPSFHSRSFTKQSVSGNYHLTEKRFLDLNVTP